MVKLLKESDLSEGSLGIGGVLERIEYLLQGQSLTRFFISDFPHDSIGSTSYFLDDVVATQNMGFDLLAHFLYFCK